MTVAAQTTITLTPTDLEALIRRAVREALTRLKPAPSALDDWSREGPDDPEGDAVLLTEALAVLDAYKDKPQGWKKWEDFEAELDQAEAAGTLPF